MKNFLTFTAMMLLFFLTIGNIGAEYNSDKSVSSYDEITTTSINIDEDEMIFCPEYWEPVCAQPPMPECPEGLACVQVMPAIKTYSNECFAGLDNAQILYEGICEGGDKTQEQIDHEKYIKNNIVSLAKEDAVLGGTWYVVDFEWLGEYEVRVVYEDGHIQDIMTLDVRNIYQEEANMIMCTMEYAPVCGVDGKTYGNRCVATEQNKVKIAYVGECSEYVNVYKFNKYKEYNSGLEYLLTKKTTKQLGNALNKLEDIIEATKLQKIAKWVQVERITIFKYFREIIRNEFQNR